LEAVADCQNGLLFGQAELQQGEIGSLALRVGISALGVPCGPKTRRIDVSGAARQNEAIERASDFTEMRRGKAKRNNDRFRACTSDRIDILFKLVEISSKFFFSTAIRDADAWLLVDW